MSDLGLNKLSYQCQKMIWRVVQNRVATEQSRQQRLLFHLCPAREWHWYNRWIIVKPDSLLLEDKSSQTSREGHNQSSALPLLFELDLVDHCDRKGNINVRSSREHCLQRSGTYSYQCISRKCFSSNMIAVEKMSSLL